jgi:hypothetical protein
VEAHIGAVLCFPWGWKSNTKNGLPAWTAAPNQATFRNRGSAKMGENAKETG